MKFFSFSDGWYYFLISAFVCYFIGCFNFAVLISRLKKQDIRTLGSGNPGTMNMTRSLGLKFGAINFFCDMAKGGIPVLIAYLIFKDFYFTDTQIRVADFARYFFGIFVVIGHIFPVTMKFKGGKGIASTMGLYVFSLPCERWWYFFIVAAFLICVLLYIAVTEWGSMGSLIGVAGLSIFQSVIFIVRYSECLTNVWVVLMFLCILGLNLLTWSAHYQNIFRLLAGEEHRTSVKKH